MAAALAGQDQPQALVGALILPIDQAPIERGTVVYHRGKILAIGPLDQVSVPDDAVETDASGKVIMPGLVDTHSHIGGIGGADSSGPIQPEVRIHDSLNPRDHGFRRALAGGITTVNVMPGSGHLCSGQTVYLKLRRSGTMEELAYRTKDGRIHGGLKMANGTNSHRDPPFPGTRGKSASLVREKFVAAQAYKKKLADAGDDPEKRPARDLALEVLVEVLDGERMVHHHTHRADDILTVLRLKEEFGFRVVLHHVSEGWKVAEEIAKAKAGCSIIVVDSPGGKLEAKDLSFRTGGVLERAGVNVAYHTDDWITDSRWFRRSGALGVRGGMSREAALRSLTLSGAEMLDLQDRVGSLTVGKDADFVVMDGDPFSHTTKVIETYVEGRRLFDWKNAEDRLYATGGMGAGYDFEPYLCCCEGGQ